MIEYIIEFFSGLMGGMFMGITGIQGFPLLILLFDYFKLDEYKKIIGAIMFVNLFPITIGSVWEFHKNHKIDFTMGWIVLLTTIIGSYLGSTMVVSGKNTLTNKMIKYISGIFSITVGILFLISGYYEKTKI